MTRTYLAILITTLFNLILYAADNENPKLKELMQLVTNHKTRLTYIRTGYQNVINAQDEEGQTALMAVVSIGMWQNIKPLIERGADPFIKNNKGQDVLTIAFKNAYTASVNIIPTCQDRIDTFEQLKPLFAIQDDQEIFKRGIEQGMTFLKYNQEHLFKSIRLIKRSKIKRSLDYRTIYHLMLEHFPNDNLPCNFDEIEPHIYPDEQKAIDEIKAIDNYFETSKHFPNDTSRQIQAIDNLIEKLKADS